MDVSSIRRKNLERLAAEIGGLRELAEAVDSSYETLWQIKQGTPLPSGNPRGMGGRLARRIEECCGKPIGWMDADHDNGGMSSAAQYIAAQYAAMPPGPDKTRLKQIIEAATGWAIPDDAVSERMPVVKPAKRR